MTHTLIISSLRTEGTLFLFLDSFSKVRCESTNPLALCCIFLIWFLPFIILTFWSTEGQMIAIADFKAALFIFFFFFVVVLVVQSSSLHEVLSDPWCIVIAIRISEDYVSRFSGDKAACYHTLFDWVFHETFLYIHRTALPVTHCIAEYDFCVSGSVVSLLCSYFLKINTRAAHLLEVKSHPPL